MGTTRPRDPRSMDPESAKKLASGFWTHEYRMDTQEDIWRCDKRKLEDAVYQILRDSRESQFFSQDPIRYLDVKFGEGTGRAYSHRNQQHNPFVNMAIPREMGMDLARGRDSMALASYASLYGTTTTGTAASNTITTTDSSDSMYWIRDEMRKQVKKTANQFFDKKAYTKKEGYAPTRKLVRNVPFAYAKGTLLATLQRDFDHWTKPQMELLRTQI